MDDTAAPDAVGGASPATGDGGAADGARVLESARAGDVAAFNELLRWYQKDAYRVAYRYLRDVTLAEDVCQDVVEEVWRLLPTFTGKVEELRFWLVRILVNKCRDLADRERVRAHVPLQRWVDDEMNDNDERLPSAMYDPGRALEQVLEREELADLLMTTIRAVHEPFRTALLLHDCDFSHAEIADLTDVNVATVRSRLRRARLQARQYLLVHAGALLDASARRRHEEDR